MAAFSPEYYCRSLSRGEPRAAPAAGPRRAQAKVVAAVLQDRTWADESVASPTLRADTTAAANNHAQRVRLEPAAPVHLAGFGGGAGLGRAPSSAAPVPVVCGTALGRIQGEQIPKRRQAIHAFWRLESRRGYCDWLAWGAPHVRDLVVPLDGVASAQCLPKGCRPLVVVKTMRSCESGTPAELRSEANASCLLSHVGLGDAAAWVAMSSDVEGQDVAAIQFVPPEQSEISVSQLSGDDKRLHEQLKSASIVADGITLRDVREALEENDERLTARLDAASVHRTAVAMWLLTFFDGHDDNVVLRLNPRGSYECLLVDLEINAVSPLYGDQYLNALLSDYLDTIDGNMQLLSLAIADKPVAVSVARVIESWHPEALARTLPLDLSPPRRTFVARQMTFMRGTWKAFRDGGVWPTLNDYFAELNRRAANALKLAERESLAVPYFAEAMACELTDEAEALVRVDTALQWWLPKRTPAERWADSCIADRERDSSTMDESI